MSFLQFLFGSLVDYHCKLLVWYKSWDGTQFDWFLNYGRLSVYANLNWNITDRWINAEKLYYATHIVCRVFFIFRKLLHLKILLHYAFGYVFYMPTIALSNLSYNALKLNNKDVIKNFPPIRV
jgi:NHS family xanthosine MFS transporter